MEPIDSGHTLTCQHTFHSACIINALRHSSACPVCRDDPCKQAAPQNATVRVDMRYHRWVRRRSRLACSHAQVGELRAAFFDARRSLHAEQAAVAKLRRRIQAEALRCPDVAAARKRCNQARRRYRTERDRYDRVVESFLGPRPPRPSLVIEVE